MTVTKLFERAGFRPEILGAAADSLRFDFSIKPADAGAAFAKAVDQQIEEADQQTLRVIHALTPLQSAVLRVLASQGDKYAPFETGTMESYRTMLAALAPDEKTVPEVSNVQAALGALQEKSLVWKEKRGVYSLEETTTAELMRAHGLLDVPALGSPWPR
jgi:N-acetylglucosamine kinase-like BadF-type ATPase